MSHPKHIYPLQIQIEHTDATGVVPHSNYLNLMLKARSEWAEEMGIGLDWQRKNQVYFAVYSAQIQFMRPVALHEPIEIVSVITKMRRASLRYEQYLRVPKVDDKLFCRAEITVACVNAAMRPCKFPENQTLSTLRRILT